MAEEARGNGQSNPPPPAPEPQQLIFNAQYIKDLSFENPRAVADPGGDAADRVPLRPCHHRQRDP